MAHTKYTNRDGSLDMRFKVNKQAIQVLQERVRMKEEALRLAEKAIESEKAPVKVEPVICCVCMDKEATQKGHAKLDCGHMYCISCFAQHARNSNKCPLCRDVFAPAPKEEREKIPSFVIADQVQDALRRFLPSMSHDDDDDVIFNLLAAIPSDESSLRLQSLLRNELTSAAIRVANWYEPSSDYDFHNTNEDDVENAENYLFGGRAARRRRASGVAAYEAYRLDLDTAYQALRQAQSPEPAQAPERAQALENAAENIAAASAGNMESVAMEIDPNPPPGFAPRQLFADEQVVLDGLNRGSSSLAEAAARASELVGSATSDSVQGTSSLDQASWTASRNVRAGEELTFEGDSESGTGTWTASRDIRAGEELTFDYESSDSTQGNPEQDFIPLESEFDAMAALAAHDDALPRSSPPEDGEIVEDDSMERYFDLAVSEAESELADAVAEIASERAAARSGGEDSFTTPIRR